MDISKETVQFIRKHRTDDVCNLALQTKKYPDIDMPFAIQQIAGWQKAQDKVPSWSQCDGLVYPVHLSLEQCSSEPAARYKEQIVRAQATDTKGRSLTDLTGGFGIDCAFMATAFEQVTYVERQETLCETARHNFPLLGLSHISVHHAACEQFLKEMQQVDWIFIDPSRRDRQGGKTIAISDCEPDVAALEERLLQKAGHVLVKLSPMLDLTLAMNELKHIQAVHVVSVGNECKELLLELTADAVTDDGIPIICVNLHDRLAERFIFSRREEKECDISFSVPQNYLYEPNASILKGGAFRSVAHRFQVDKLHPHSHLYTSAHLVKEFPGRKFRIIACCGFGKKEVRALLGKNPHANLTVRNFPVSVSELRKQLKLTDGGENYLFATTLADGTKRLICCERL